MRKKSTKILVFVLVVLLAVAGWVLLRPIPYYFFPPPNSGMYHIWPVSVYALLTPLPAAFAWFRRPGILTLAALLLACWCICGVPGAFLIWSISRDIFASNGVEAGAKILTNALWWPFATMSLYVWAAFVVSLRWPKSELFGWPAFGMLICAFLSLGYAAMALLALSPLVLALFIGIVKHFL
jgi:hypothetical protein